MNRPKRFHPWRLLTASILSLMFSFTVWVVGVGFEGWVLSEQCSKRGFPYDPEHISELRKDGKFSKLFPLSAPCNAHDNLIPIWINPTIVIFFLGKLILLVFSLSSFVRRHQASKNFDRNR